MYEIIGDLIHAAHACVNLSSLALQSGDLKTAAHHFDNTLPILQ
jgi:hypothetical protein